MFDLIVATERGDEPFFFEPRELVIAGWTGRDADAVEAHIVELEALGVTRPATVPIFYRVSADRLTTAGSIQVVGQEGSGEVEAVLFKHDGELFVGVGSDHTDRKLEAVGITLSKQLCSKPISRTVWRWRDVAEHWDQVSLSSTVGGGVRYQHGSTSALRRPDALLEIYEGRQGSLPDGSVMFCGTLPVEGGIRFADEMTLELWDPILDRSIVHRYAIDVLPIVEASA